MGIKLGTIDILAGNDYDDTAIQAEVDANTGDIVNLQAGAINGLKSYGNGRFDNHFISLSLSYNFGNQKLKSRKRKTGLESESKRVG